MHCSMVFNRRYTIRCFSNHQEDIRDIQEVSITRFRRNHEIEKKAYAESNIDAFPVIGSRVRRGPDWTWDNQDHDWCGTVVGHSEDGLKIESYSVSTINFNYIVRYCTLT